MFGAIGRWIKAVGYLLTGQIDSARRVLDTNPHVVRAKYDAIIRDKVARIQTYKQAVAGLIAQQENKMGTVKRLTGLAFHRLPDASADDLDLAGGSVDGEWLSERLLGVQVLLLAGCEGDRVGDWLGVVPYVVTLDEAIGHDDAAVLCEHFWTGIGKGEGPGAALAAALSACAPVVGEYVVRHW